MKKQTAGRDNLGKLAPKFAELNLDTCFTFRDVCNEIKDYIEYYNNYRYQWNLKKMTPVQYRNHLFTSIA